MFKVIVSKENNNEGGKVCVMIAYLVWETLEKCLGSSLREKLVRLSKASNIY